MSEKREKEEPDDFPEIEEKVALMAAESGEGVGVAHEGEHPPEPCTGKAAAQKSEGHLRNGVQRRVESSNRFPEHPNLLPDRGGASIIAKRRIPRLPALADFAPLRPDQPVTGGDSRFNGKGAIAFLRQAVEAANA